MTNPALAQQVAPPLHALAEDPAPADTAWQLVHDELMLDGRYRLNLATFVTTWMEQQAGLLMAECADKNMIDKDEYPQTAEFERRCVAILADLWHAPDPADVIGCSTTGSSEATIGVVAILGATFDGNYEPVAEIAALGPFRLISRGDQVPAFAFTTTDDVTGFDVFDVFRRLRERGWLVPAYTFPADRNDLSVLQVVIRNGFTHDLAGMLLDDLRRLLPELHAQPAPVRSADDDAGFHH